ncbi:metal ABC transporter substrate-binding protein [Candidatus Nitrosocosmicus sp. R]
MRENYKTWISFCFIVLTITLFSSIIPKSIATSNLSQNNNNNNSIKESESQSLISSNNTNLKIFSSFYPIYDFVKKIGKDRVDVSTIVPAGIEPHDFEPTAKQVIELQKADVIFINGAGFESWINKIGNANVVDLSKDLPIENIRSTPDPHIWLDPNLVKAYSKTIFEKFISLDPQNTDYYTSNFNEFNSKLELLNSDINMNLTNCDLNDFIAFHDAFGYFAKRYGLTQHSISGLSPEGDINPQKITEAIKLAEQLGVNIIFSEDNIEPRLSDTIAKEIGGKVMRLSPIEMITQEEQTLDKDYFSKMYDNLDNLKIALKCEN